MSLQRFSHRIRLRADQLPASTNRVVRRVALAVNQAVILATPVDTGAARSNWLTSIGAPRGETIHPYAPLPKRTDPSKLGESANAQAAIDQGRAAIGRRKPGDGPGNDIFISNNVDYIEKLNDGHSAQAPAGFVEEAVQAAIQAIRTSKLR